MLIINHELVPLPVPNGKKCSDVQSASKATKLSSTPKYTKLNKNVHNELGLNSKIHLQDCVELFCHTCMLCHYIVHLRYNGAKQRSSKEEEEATKDLITKESVKP